LKLWFPSQVVNENHPLLTVKTGLNLQKSQEKKAQFYYGNTFEFFAYPFNHVVTLLNYF